MTAPPIGGSPQGYKPVFLIDGRGLPDLQLKGTPVPSRIEDYALIADTQTGGLVGATGQSTGYVCPVDSGACYAAVSGDDADARAIVFEPEFARLLQTAARFTIAFTQIVSEVQPPTLRPLIHLDHDLP